MATDRFVESAAANLDYWRCKLAACDDPAACELMSEGLNIYRAIEFGLAFDATWRQAAELIVALDSYIEPSGAWQSWQALIQDSIKRCGQGDQLLMLKLLDLSGKCHRKVRNWDSSIAAFEEEERIGRELGETEFVARAHYGLATLYWRLREYETAKQFSQQALVEFQAARAGERLMGGVQASIGLIEYGRGRYEAAVEAFETAVGHFRRTKYSVLLARALINLALAQEYAGETDLAAASYLEARSILEPTGYEIEKTRLELSLGTLLFNLKRFEEAEDCYLRAYSPHLKRSGLTYLLGLATNNLGAVYLELEKYEIAETMLQLSLSYWERAKAPLQIANSTGNLGKVWAAQGRYAEALEEFDLAISAAEAFPDDGYARSILEEFQEEKIAVLQRNEREGHGL